ncbi:MAG: hypothetical protein AB8G16_06705 [Gammaproteobacteria bacterium]
MKQKTYFYPKAMALLASMLLGAQAQAALLTFNLGWSGSALGNSASATAVLVVDDEILPNPGSTGLNGESVLFGDLGIVSFDIVVTGASSGNGSFSTSDFIVAAWDTGGMALDLTTELVGQTTTGAGWGTSDSSSGDFNVFTNIGSAPSGTFFFTLTTDSGLGDDMLLTNFTPVPVGAALPLLISAMGTLGFMRRRRNG